MEEPTVLDYVKSLLQPKRRRQKFPLTIFSINGKPQKTLKIKKDSEKNPYKLIVAVVLVVFAQFQLEPPSRNTIFAIILYFAAGVLCWLEIPQFTMHQKPGTFPKKPSSVRMISFIFSLLFVLAAFWTFNNNRFTLINLCLWIMAIVLFIYSTWERLPKNEFKKLRLFFFVYINLIIFQEKCSVIMPRNCLMLRMY